MSLSPWVESVVDVAEASHVNVRVDLGGANVRVAEKFLNRADVSAVLEHVRGEAVPEDVGGNALWRDVGSDGPLADHLEDRLASKRLLEPSDKDVRHRKVAFREHVAGRGEIRRERPSRGLAYRDDALLRALAEDAKKLAVGHYVLDLHAADLADAKSAAVHYLKHCAVAQVAGISSVDLVYHPESLFFGKDSGEHLSLLRRIEKRGGASPYVTPLLEELEEHPNRRSAPRPRRGLASARPLFAEKARYVFALDVRRGGYAALFQVFRKEPQIPRVCRAGILGHRPLEAERPDKGLDIRVWQ